MSEIPSNEREVVEMQTDLGRQIKYYRKKVGLTQVQLAEKANISRSYLGDIEGSRYNASLDTLYAIASALGVGIAELLGPDKRLLRQGGASGGEADPGPFIPATGTVPILGVIRAGQPLLAEEHIEGYMPVMVNKPEEYFCLRVTGDSMTGAGIVPGSKVLIHRQTCAENGQIVVCRVNGNDATLKRFKQQGETVILLPENSLYEPLILPCSDFDSGEAELIGVVKQIIIDV